MLKKSIFIMVLLAASFKIAAQRYAVKYFNFTSQEQSLRMAYVYEHPNTNGKTILLLHGKNFSNTYWHNTITQLLQRGYNVLAPDQVGFGNSSMPQQYQFSFQQLALNTQQLMDSLGIKQAIVLAHSMGGMLAIRFALMYPQVCQQLVLEDPIGLEDWKVVIPYSPIGEQFKKELNQTKEGLKKYMTENYFHDEWKINYDSLLMQSSKNLGNKKYAWCMALTTDMLFTQPVYYEMNILKMPVVLIVGDLDKTAPGKERVDKQTAALLGNYKKLGEEASHIIPLCKLVVLKGIGHIPHVEDFNLFINTLDDILLKN